MKRKYIISFFMKMAMISFFLLPSKDIMAKTIPVNKNPAKKLSVAYMQETVTGTVKDAITGNPLIGVTVVVIGTTQGAVTDSKGNYKIQVTSLKDTLRFSYTGYVTKVVPVNGKSMINITMNTKVQGLDQLVVIGFGTQSKRNIVGSVSSVDVDQMRKKQASTFTQQLEGKVSGVNVIRSTGRLGSPVTINVRGASSINASSQPLYVIDGVPVEANSVGSGEIISPFINLNPDDIKSIDILKGATAAAVYGTRGANGVIIITTKSGNANSQRISISVEGGITNVANKLKLMNTSEYLKVYNYLHQTDYMSSDFANTDWQDAVSRQGTFQKYNVAISGGSKKNTFFLSAHYGNEKGMILNNSLERFGARVKIKHKINDKVDVFFNIAPSVSHLKSLSGHATINTAFGMAVLNPPTVPIFLPNGAINNGKDPSVEANIIFNPFAGTPYANVIGSDILNNSKQILANIGASYKIFPKLTFKSNVNYRYYGNNRNTNYKNTTSTGYPNGEIGASSWLFNSINWNNTLSYKAEWGKNSIDLTLVSTLEKHDYNRYSLSKSDVTDESLTDLDAASKILSGEGSRSAYDFQNNVIRISYNYNEKYLLTFSGSYDGTSRFAKGHRYGFFPSIAGGWIISEEGFIKESNVINFLKLRIGYGITGNANIGNFDYLPLLSSGISYNEKPGLEFSQLANLDLTWETGHEFDLGLDFGFLNNRISGTLDFYRKMTTNLLLQRRVSNINGFTTIFRNGGKMLNSGIEFSFDAKLIKTKNVSWSINGNISTLRNKVVDLPGGQIIGDFPNIIREGEPLASFYLPVYEGVDPQNGDALYSDGKGGTTPNYSESPRIIAGSPFPEFFGGFGSSFSFKGLDLSANFNYTYGNKLYWVRAEYMKGATSTYNQLESVADFWTSNNKDAKNPEPRLNPNGNNESTRFLYDGSFLRLGSLQFGYTLPKPLFGEKSIRVYIGGSNLFTVSNFEGFDPEVSSDPRSNISRGIIQGNDPQSIGFNFGLQVIF